MGNRALLCTWTVTLILCRGFLQIFLQPWGANEHAFAGPSSEKVTGEEGDAGIQRVRPGTIGRRNCSQQTLMQIIGRCVSDSVALVMVASPVVGELLDP